VVCSRDDVKHGLKEFYGLGAEMADAIVRARGSNSDPMGTESTTIDGDDRQEARTVVQFVNTVLVEAYRRNATDVHIEPLDHDVRVRFRIDGMLQPVKTPGSARQFRDAIVSRIKVMAGLDIAEKRIPQDGRISVTVAGEELDLRVSVLPSIFGEAVDIRLLNSATHFLDLHQLGIARADLETLEGVIRKPHGIVLLTGPTGSGKTTTLYAALKRIRSDDIKIITIEDPVEYRHDPDVMMVGEIRDEQTAQIATRVALTGHLVFSTLHTNDAASAVTRLADMGIERYLVASTLECVVAQRLVRVICDECKGRRSLRGVTPPASYGVVELPEAVWQGAGCDRCLHTGYRGRVAIYEMLLLDDDLRGLVARTAEAAEIKAVARSRGMRTMMEHGVELVASGVTTLEELFRVTQADPVRR
jgi:type II secretory ATPase GspE/PulE/Tfp pilus assembly ATPase PilB-like protein